MHAPHELATSPRPRQESTRRGVFVVVVGPDGVGKTTVARALAEHFDGPTAYFHFLPPVWRRLPASPPHETDPQPLPRRGADGSRVIGWCRLARSFVRGWLGYLTRVRPALDRGCLVVGDRWVYGYIAEPDALRFYGPRWLGALALRLLPQPHLVANLSAPPELIRQRKQELSLAEIDRGLAEWASVPAHRALTFPALESPGAIARLILTELRT